MSVNERAKTRLERFGTARIGNMKIDNTNINTFANNPTAAWNAVFGLSLMQFSFKNSATCSRVFNKTIGSIGFRND